MASRQLTEQRKALLGSKSEEVEIEESGKTIRISVLTGLPLLFLLFTFILGLLIWGNIQVWSAIF